MSRCSPWLSVIVILLAGCGGDGSGPWRVQTLDTDVGFMDMQFLDVDNGWMVGGSYQIEGGFLARTRDGGQTWTFRSGLAGTGSTMRGFDLAGVHFLDAERGFLVGHRGVILRTDDGGETWRSVHRGPRVSSHLFEIQFVDQKTGWAVGPGGLQRTEDGGETWHTPVTGGSRGTVNGRDLHFLNTDRGFLVGQHGALRFTEDGGETWTRIEGALPEGVTPYLWDVFFLDERTGWIVGERGALLATTDGGQTWEYREIAPDLFQTAVHFEDPRNGWIIGYVPHHAVSRILRTADGGVTWEVEAEVTGEELRVLEFLDPGHAWAIGDRARNEEPQKLLRRVVELP